MWSYNPTTQKTTDAAGIIPRVKVEEAIDLMRGVGMQNRVLMVDVLAALSGLSKPEIRFNVDLVFEGRSLRSSRITPATVKELPCGTPP